MAMTDIQGVTWKQMVQAYKQWDPDWNGFMPVSEARKALPGADPGLIDESLTQAADDQLVEVRGGDAPEFRPRQDRVTGVS